MKLLFVPVLVAALGQAGDDPTVRMKAMEEKIAKAKSIQFTFDGKIEGSKGKRLAPGHVDRRPRQQSPCGCQCGFHGQEGETGSGFRWQQNRDD